MLRPIREMPAGIIGFEAAGEVEGDDWEQTVEPVLRREMAEGRKIRLPTWSAPGRETSMAMR